MSDEEEEVVAIDFSTTYLPKPVYTEDNPPMCVICNINVALHICPDHVNGQCVDCIAHVGEDCILCAVFNWTADWTDIDVVVMNLMTTYNTLELNGPEMFFWRVGNVSRSGAFKVLKQAVFNHRGEFRDHCKKPKKKQRRS
jgi:hypothetical protein